jgi:hypothetical protein
MTASRPRRWLVQEPTLWRTLGLFQALRAEDACSAAARSARIDCDAFQASWLPTSRALQARGDGVELYATDVTALGELDALKAMDAAALLAAVGDADGGFYTARSG